MNNHLNVKVYHFTETVVTAKAKPRDCQDVKSGKGAVLENGVFRIYPDESNLDGVNVRVKNTKTIYKFI